MQQGSPYPNAMAPGWSGMDDATLDAVIMDPAASAAQKAAAAAAKRSRSVMRVAQPTMERMGNDLSGVADMARGDPDSNKQSTYETFIAPAVGAIGNVASQVGDWYSGLGRSRAEAQPSVPPAAFESPEVPNQSPRDYGQPEFSGIFPGMGGPARAQAAAQQPQRSPTDAAIEAGTAAAQRAMPVAQPAAPVAPAGQSPEGDLNFSPGFMELAKQYINAQDQDAPLTAEDKWLALARAGFGMAASDAPSFGQALGEGAMGGITQLQQVRAQRAEQAARRAQMGLQVAGTEAQLRQGDRTYELQKGKMAQDAAEAEAKKPLIEAQVNELRTSAALNLARAGATKALGSSGSSKLALAQQLMDERAEAGQPISLEQAIQLTFKGSPDISRTAALNVAMKAREMAEVSGRTVAEEIDGLLTDADRISGLSGGTASSSGGGAPSAAPAVAASTTPIVVKSQKDIDNAPPGAVLIVNGQQFKKP
jgi:hypothetical protein